VSAHASNPSSANNPPLAPEIFKAYDIRGVVGKTLTAPVVERIGRAIGSEAMARGAREVVVGRDGRLSGPELVEALTRGLNAAGCDVIDIGMVPTPVLYFATYELGTHTGVSVTGSHNPPDYNGLKMMIAGETLSGEAIQGLRRRLESGDLASGSGGRREVDVVPRYIERIASDVKLARPLHAVIDCGNGVAGAVAPKVLKAMGCELRELYCDVDGTFPNHHPDPSQPANLKDLIAALAEGGSDVGLAFDGDGDRLGVVAPDGTVIWPDRQLILFARDVLTREPGAEIIFDVKCSRTVPAAVTAAGGKPTMWKTGHSFIKAKLKETGAALAGEMSGHIFFKERWYGFDDGIYAAARLMELLSRDARTATEVFADLPNTVNTPELQIKTAEGEHFALVQELVDKADFPGARVSTIDGLRVDFDDGFGLVRPSNTTPVVVLRFEGDTPQALDRIQDRFRELLHRVRPGLDLPF
jgi:phosphomannomutase/phosphoglucomutase